MDAFIKRAKAAKGVEEVEVGFYSSDRYPDGKAASDVALFQEFGTENTPERPFFRIAILNMEGKILDVLKREINPHTMVVSRRGAQHAGEVAQREIQDTALRLRVKDSGFLVDHVQVNVKE